MASYFESMLFNYETCNRTDFRYGEIKPIIKTTYKKKPTCTMTRPPPLKDIHTLSDWKTATVPIDLLVPLKDIVRTNPWKIQKTYVKPPDLEREQIQMTRPRLVMTPAVSMDDIPAQEVRQVLIEDVYTTAMQRAMREGLAASETEIIHAPFPGTPAPSNPITLRQWTPPYVAREWRMDSVSWDGRQLRAKCDPDKEFYLARTPKCNACKVSAYLKSEKLKPAIKQ